MSALRSVLFIVWVALGLLLTPRAGADTPSVSYIFPAGGQRGTTTRFHVGGHYLRDVCLFEMLGPDVSASPELKRGVETIWFEGPVIPMPASQAKEDYPRDQWGQVTIEKDAQPGFRRWRTWTSQGVTPTMKFVVGDLPEILEKEIDGKPVPALVQLPLTINGRIFPREDVDIWTFQAQAGQQYTAEVMAARLGSPLDSRLIVLDPAGKKVAENTDALGKDSYLRFQASQNGTYQVRIHDAEFGGLQHYVYRLTIRNGFCVDHVYPLGGRRGSTLSVQLFSKGMPVKEASITLPGTPSLPYYQRVQLEDESSHRFPFELSNFPEFLETESAQSDEVNQVELPAVLNGRIAKAGEIDLWHFTGKKETSYLFDLKAERAGSPLDSVMRLLDAEGKELAQSDDMAKDQSDSQFQFKLPADGRYAIEIKERFARRGGIRYAYRLQVAPKVKEAAGFELRLPADGVTLNRGTEAKMKITAERTGGFPGSIALQVKNLPEGVTVADISIAEKKNDATLVLKSDAKSPIQVSKIQVIGTAKIDDKEVTRVARQVAGSPMDLEVDHCLLAVSMPTPFKVIGQFETKYAARGATFLRHYTIERGGFQGPLEIRLGDRQVRHLQGVRGGTVMVPAGVTEFDYAIQLAPWMEVGRTSRTCVMAVGFVEDEKGEKHEVSYTSHEQNDQIILLVDPGQLSVQVSPRSAAWKPAAGQDLKVTIGRGQGLQEPARIELVVPKHIRGVEAKPIVIAAGENQGILKVQCGSDSHGPFNMPLIIRATVIQGKQPYTAEQRFDLVGPR